MMIDLVREGAEMSSIELVLSLDAFPTAVKNYGREVSLRREIYRFIPLEQSNFQMKLNGEGEFKFVSKNFLRSFLNSVNLNKFYYRILLLDLESVSYMMDYGWKLWYKLFLTTFKEVTVKTSEKLKILGMKRDRLFGEIEWRESKEDFIKSEMEESNFLKETWSQIDEISLSRVKEELVDLYSQKSVLDSEIDSTSIELLKIPNNYRGRLKFRYKEFLQRQDLTGSVLIDEINETISIWISKSPLFISPTTMEEVRGMWNKTTRDLKVIGVTGLYFSLWDICEKCPIFFIDGFSTSNNNSEIKDSSLFSVDKRGLSILYEIIERKMSRGGECGQIVASLPLEEAKTKIKPAQNAH